MIDLALAKYRSAPGVIEVARDGAVLIAVVDGAGSWGTGVEAAAWAAERLAERWDRRFAGIEAIAGDVRRIGGEVPGGLRDSEWGWGFSVTALVIRGDEIEGVAAGLFDVALVGPSRREMLYEGRTLLRDLVQRGDLAPSEASAFVPDVYTGTLVGDSDTCEPFRIHRTRMAQDEVVLCARYDVLRRLGGLVAPEWDTGTAAELQALAVERGAPPAPLVLVRP